MILADDGATMKDAGSVGQTKDVASLSVATSSPSRPQWSSEVLVG